MSLADVRLTDERLRSWLNTNQPCRERMCQAILSSQEGYSQVKPRHPEGGPDSACDIDALFYRKTCCVAVGFINDAGSSSDFRSIRAKFCDDIDNRVKTVGGTEFAFTFFTNVKLTLGEKDQLTSLASSKGIQTCDIFDRERIRTILDSEDGFVARYQYLDIAMNDVEQKAFFAKYGRDLNELMSNKFNTLSEQLRPIRFELWRTQPLREMRLDVFFDGVVDLREIGLFRVLACMEGLAFNRDAVYLGGEYHLENHGLPFTHRTVFGMQSTGQTPVIQYVDQRRSPQFSIVSPNTSVSFCINCQQLTSSTGSPLPEVLNRLIPRVQFTNNLEGIVKFVRWIAGPYVIFECGLKDRAIKQIEPIDPWPGTDCTTKDSGCSWRGVVDAALMTEFDYHIPTQYLQ